jgi:hypothetical protein
VQLGCMDDRGAGNTQYDQYCNQNISHIGPPVYIILLLFSQYNKDPIMFQQEESVFDS